MDTSAQLLNVLNLLTQIVKNLQEERGVPKQYSESVEKYNKKDGYGKEQTTFTASEREKAIKTAKIFKDVFGFDKFHTKLTGSLNSLTNAIVSKLQSTKFVESDTEISRKENAKQKFVQQVKLVGISDNIAVLLAKKQETPKNQKEKKETSSSGLFSKIFGAVGLTALAVGAYALIKGLIDFKKINLKSISGVTSAIGDFLSGIGKMPGASIIKGLIGTIAGVTGIVYAIGKIPLKVGLKGIASIAALSWIMNNDLAPALMKLGGLDWNTTADGLKLAGIAIGGMAALAAIIGGLETTGIGALVAVAGTSTIFLLAKALGYTAEQLQKYEGLNGQKLTEAGKGIGDISYALFKGFIGMTTGSIGGIIDGLTSLFSLDPVSRFKRFEQLDGAKLSVSANALATLAKSFTKINPGNAIVLAKSAEVVANSLQGIVKLYQRDRNTANYIAQFTNTIKTTGIALTEGTKTLNPQNVSAYANAIDICGGVLSKINDFFKTSIFGKSSDEQVNSFSRSIISFGTSLDTATSSLKEEKVNAFGRAISALGPVLDNIKNNFEKGAMRRLFDAIGFTEGDEKTLERLNNLINTLGKGVNTSVKDIDPVKVHAFGTYLNGLKSLKDLQNVDPVKVEKFFDAFKGKSMEIALKVKTEYESVLTELNKAALKVHQLQLEQLKLNGYKLDLIVTNTSVPRIGGSNTSEGINMPPQVGASLTKMEHINSLNLHVASV